MVEFYLLTFPRFPLRKKEHKSYFGKNQTHDFRTTSRCADYLLDHSGDEAFFQSFHFRATYNSDESFQRFSFHATKPIELEGYFLEKSPKKREWRYVQYALSTRHNEDLAHPQWKYWSSTGVIDSLLQLLRRAPNTCINKLFKEKSERA